MSIFPKNLPDKIDPCEHMVTLVSRRSDESLKGVGKIYTDFHMLTCSRCREALRLLRGLRTEVKQLDQESTVLSPRLSDERWKQIREQIDKIG